MLMCKHFRYTSKDLPLDEERLKQFLNDRWHAKENFLAHFANNHQLPPGERQLARPSAFVANGNNINVRNSIELYIAFIFWTLLPCAVIYVLTASQLFRRYVIIHTIFFLCVSHFGGGFQNFEIALHNLKRRLHLAG